MRRALDGTSIAHHTKHERDNAMDTYLVLANHYAQSTLPDLAFSALPGAPMQPLRPARRNILIALARTAARMSAVVRSRAHAVTTARRPVQVGR
jgi:hypothetical protein